jgi:hypothetical protein
MPRRNIGMVIAFFKIEHRISTDLKKNKIKIKRMKEKYVRTTCLDAFYSL